MLPYFKGLFIMRIRQETTKSEYPHNVVRITGPTMRSYIGYVIFHFKNRSIPAHRKAAHMWLQEVKRFDAACGYSTALAQTNKV